MPLLLSPPQMDKESRVIFKWKSEVAEQKEMASDMRRRNEKLVYNILPVGVFTMLFTHIFGIDWRTTFSISGSCCRVFHTQQITLLWWIVLTKLWGSWCFVCLDAELLWFLFRRCSEQSRIGMFAIFEWSDIWFWCGKQFLELISAFCLKAPNRELSIAASWCAAISRRHQNQNNRIDLHGSEWDMQYADDKSGRFNSCAMDTFGDACRIRIGVEESVAVYQRTKF